MVFRSRDRKAIGKRAEARLIRSVARSMDLVQLAGTSDQNGLAAAMKAEDPSELLRQTRKTLRRISDGSGISVHADRFSCNVKKPYRNERSPKDEGTCSKSRRDSI
jgi:hypothetical protein